MSNLHKAGKKGWKMKSEKILALMTLIEKAQLCPKPAEDQTCTTYPHGCLVCVNCWLEFLSEEINKDN